MAKWRKLSDLSHEETSTVVNILQGFQNEIDEEDISLSTSLPLKIDKRDIYRADYGRLDEDEDGKEVVDALQKVVRDCRFWCRRDEDDCMGRRGRKACICARWICWVISEFSSLFFWGDT